METGALGWEAAPAAFELLRYAKQGPPPPVRLVKWFWRVTAADEDADFGSRLLLAEYLAVGEVLGASEVKRWSEAMLVYAPWRSEEAGLEYAYALESGAAPHLVLPSDQKWPAEAADVLLWLPAKEPARDVSSEGEGR